MAARNVVGGGGLVGFSALACKVCIAMWMPEFAVKQLHVQVCSCNVRLRVFVAFWAK